MAESAFTSAVSVDQVQGLILDRLASEGAVEPAALARAQLIARRNGQAVEQVLNQIGALSDDGLAHLYAEICGCPVWNPALEPIEIDWRELGVTEDFLRRGGVLPLRVAGGELHCAALNPLDREAAAGLSFAAGLPVAMAAARPRDWRRAWDELFSRPQGEAAADERRLAREIDQVSDSGAQGAGARVVATAFEAAIAAGASDIHFEPRRHDLLIRLRIDGRLIEHQAVSADLAAPAVSRIKVIANLDLGEKRLPQDGRTTFVIGGRQVDVRVATSPTVFGEAAVLRLLDRTAVPLDLPTLGLSEPVARLLRQAVRSPHGLFLVTGPTGSGKTTTLYALLQMFAGSAKK
ncbi:MAG: ral secretion pathway protein, partial [Caulobacteraceae bacterium]|nr:ral secretion pathway protein [Caulobacteraceae bacterium]